MFPRRHQEEQQPLSPEDVDSDLPCSFEPRIVVIIGLMAGVLCLTFFAMLYAHNCGRFAARVLRRRSSSSSNRDNVGTGASPGSSSNNSTNTSCLSLVGVSQRVIDALPNFQFSSVGGLKQGMECAVCLSRYQEKDVLRLLPRCRHAFHSSCIDKWLVSRSTCPLCRSPVSPDDVVNMKDLLSKSDGGGELLQVVVDPPDHRDLQKLSNTAANWRIAPTASALMMQRQWSHSARTDEFRKGPPSCSSSSSASGFSS